MFVTSLFVGCERVTPYAAHDFGDVSEGIVATGGAQFLQIRERVFH